jgi:hypothetical protein
MLQLNSANHPAIMMAKQASKGLHTLLHIHAHMHTYTYTCTRTFIDVLRQAYTHVYAHSRTRGDGYKTKRSNNTDPRATNKL